MALCLAGCNKNDTPASPEQELFLKENVPGIFENGTPVIRYDKFEHQLCLNSLGTLLRIQNDNLSKVYECRFSQKPLELNGSVTVSIVFEGTNHEKISDAEFKTIKTGEGKYWCWNEELKTGIITTDAID